MMRLLLLSACCHGVLAFSSSTIRTAFANSGKHVNNNNIKNNNINFGPSPTGLHATTTKTVVFDGPEWSSIQQAMPDRTTPTTLNSCGVMTVAVGTFEGERMVGVVAEQDSSDATVTLDNNSRVYQHTLAKLPAKIPDQDALTTVVAALVGIQCTAPRLDSVGGSSQSECLVSGRVVVLGGSDYAAFCAEGLAACGAHVYWVSTNNVNIQHPNVEILPPAMPDGKDDEIGFAAYVGDFDVLLDTVHDERPSRLPQIDDNDDNDNDNDAMMGMGTTLRLLRQRHQCERYVSSMTQAQRIINAEGVLFGPGKVKNHVKELVGNIANYESIVPPPSFGQTIATLLNAGILYQNNKDFLSDKNVAVRGWSLKDFIEYSTWPTDSSGGGTRMVRYGLPVLEEEDDDDDDGDEFTMISEPPSVAEVVLRNREEATQDDQNPFVKRIVGEPGFYETIVKEERDCVLFLSATFCRTCKTLNPRFTNLARTTMEESGSYGLDDENYNGLLFAKADTGGKTGKELSRLLNIESVPAFVLFRKGRRFGPVLSLSRIPSKQLSAAINLLKSGSDWDASVIQEAENERQ